MNTGSDITAPKCPHCGNAIPPEAHGGLCPRCVLLTAATPTEVGTEGAPRGERPTLAEVAEAFPELEVLDWIGSGGMGSVYRARRRADGTVVALKLLPRALAGRPEFVERFGREARALERLRHPNIVGIHAHGQQGGFCYLMMEHVDGPNLRQAMRSGRFSAAQSLEIVPSICSALQYAHSQGVLHRDLKPENLLLDAEGRVKIADFGIAKIVGDASGAPGEITLTRTGGRLGTPHYMAPEQIERPEWVDHRADIYSVGVVFYELLTGELPLGRFPAPSTKAYIDARVDDIVFRALAKERELRQQSADQVRAEVEGLSQAPTPQVSAPSPASVPETVLRRDSCYISTHEHLRSWYGGIYIYTGGGELELTRHTLRLRGSKPVEIPLKSITAVALGEYPRATKPTGLLHFDVRFRRTPDGPEEVLLFTPYRSMWNATWTTNEKVREWHRHLVEAVAEVQGRIPPDSIPGSEVSSGGPKQWAVMLCLFAIPMLIGIGLMGLMISMKGRVGPVELLLIVAESLGVAAAIGIVVAAFQRLIRGRWPGGWFWWLMAAVGLAVFLRLGGWLLWPEPSLPAPPLAVSWSQAVEAQNPEVSELNLIVRDIPVGRRIRLRTIQWSNGIPTVLPELECLFGADDTLASGVQLGWSLRPGGLRFRRSTASGQFTDTDSKAPLVMENGGTNWVSRVQKGVKVELGENWNALNPGIGARFLLFAPPWSGDSRDPGAVTMPTQEPLQWGIEARFDLVPANSGDPLDATADGASLRIRSHTANSDPEWIRTTWDFESRQPATWSVDFHGRSPELAFAPATNGASSTATFELRVERRKEGDGVRVQVFAEDGLRVLDRTVKGDPVALMKEADAVSRRGGEGLEPSWPFWLAEIGGERITLRRRTVASEGSGVALIGMWRTQQEFALRQKKVEAGLLAPSGPEILESEYSLALAGALVHGDALGGRRAHLEYRKRTLERIEAEVRAGRRPESDLKSARADLIAARAAVQAAEEAAPRPASGTQAAPPSVSKPEGRPVR